MKKNIKIIILSILIGATLALIFFLNVKEKAMAKNRNIIYAFQVGVFKQEQNALNLSKKYENIKVMKDSLYYRVFIGTTISNQEKLKNHFRNLQYNYYIKEIEVSNEIMEKITKFDELLNNSNEENIDIIIKNTLESLPNEL